MSNSSKDRLRTKEAVLRSILNEQGYPDISPQKDEDVVDNTPDIISPTQEKEKLLPDIKTKNQWYGHIQRLIMDVYVIESPTGKKCKKCEAWKKNPYEKELIWKLHELLGLSEENVKVHLYGCDWDCLNIEDGGYQFSEAGWNWADAMGKGVGYYPAVILYIDSTKIPKNEENKKKELRREKKEFREKGPLSKFDNLEGYEQIVFAGIEGFVYRKHKYKIGNEIYEQEVRESDTSILRYVLKYLRTLDPKDVPLHDQTSDLLGQYHHLTQMR